MAATGIALLQQNLGVSVSKQWDDQTRGGLAPYQKSGHGPIPMFVTGLPDPATLVNLGYYDPVPMLSRGQRSYLEGGARPTSLWRDLSTASNQTPQLVWIGLGVLFAGLGYYMWRKQAKKQAR